MSGVLFDSRRHWRAWLLLAAGATALDQGVKWIVASALPLGDQVAVAPWFNLVHVLNPGAAFSFFSDAGGWQRHFLSVVGTVVSLVLALFPRMATPSPRRSGT